MTTTTQVTAEVIAEKISNLERRLTVVEGSAPDEKLSKLDSGVHRIEEKLSHPEEGITPRLRRVEEGLTTLTTTVKVSTGLIAFLVTAGIALVALFRR